MERIDGAIGPPDLPALVTRFRELLDQGDLDIDLTGLTGIDTAGLQLLVSARAEAATRGHAFALRMPLEGPVPTLIAQLGLGYAFDPAIQANDPNQEMTN